MNVDVVIVTYNRLEKLKKALASYENQSKTFRNMIVVNNHSTDGTYEYLEAWKNEETPFTKYVITTEDNLGGSGGFYTGQEFAMTLNPDWVYLADDDAYAEHDMMEQFYKFCETHDVSKLSAICGAVCDMEGKVCCYHRSTYKTIKFNLYRKDSKTEDYELPFFEIDFLSYVCSFINARAIGKVGMVDSRYFIYFDDSEHSLRLQRFGPIVCVPLIRINHEDGGSKGYDEGIIVSWQEYYMIRNEINMMKRHHFFVALNKFRKELWKLYVVHSYPGYYEPMVKAAVKDGWGGKLGLHGLYRPGWKITNKDTESNICR